MLDAVAAGQLHVTPEQQGRVEQIFEDMAGSARRLGQQIIAEEAALDAAFRAGTIDGADLRGRVSRIAALGGELRSVHMGAHLGTRALLSAAQIARDNELRGYMGESGQPEHQHQHR